MHVEWKTVSSNMQVTRNLKIRRIYKKNVLHMSHQPKGRSLDLSVDQSRYLFSLCVYESVLTTIFHLKYT